MRSIWVLPLAISTAIGCNDSGPAQDEQEEIASSGTLVVTATAAGTNGNYINEADPSLFSTGFTVTVATVDQRPITDAVVTITGDGEPIRLASGPETGSSYRAWMEGGYDAEYTLDIDAGADYLTGFTVSGPDVHVFTSPTASDVVPAGQPLVVQWDRAIESQATISKSQSDSAPVPDTGSYTYAGELVTPERNDFIVLTRSIEQTTDDGLASFTVQLSNVVIFSVAGQ